jgi:uncharacterized protein (DUF433 family)
MNLGIGPCRELDAVAMAAGHVDCSSVGRLVAQRAPGHSGRLRYRRLRGQVVQPLRAVVSIDPDILAGLPCFAGTRVPVQTLIDYLKAGDRVDDFLVDFPTVQREQIAAMLDAAGEALAQYARSA